MILATDGSRNEDRVGYGGVVGLENGRVIHTYCGRIEKFHQFRAAGGECEAVLKGLEWCYRHEYYEVKICFDFIHLENWAMGYCRRRSGVAIYYARRMQSYLDSMDITWEWVKAHSGSLWNELAHKQAVKAVGKK